MKEESTQPTSSNFKGDGRYHHMGTSMLSLQILFLKLKVRTYSTMGR